MTRALTFCPPRAVGGNSDRLTQYTELAALAVDEIWTRRPAREIARAYRVAAERCLFELVWRSVPTSKNKVTNPSPQIPHETIHRAAE